MGRSGTTPPRGTWWRMAASIRSIAGAIRGPELCMPHPETRDPGAPPGPPADGGDAAPFAQLGFLASSKGWATAAAPWVHASVAAIETPIKREATRATDKDAGRRMVGQQVGAIAVGRVAVDIVNKILHLCAQRLVDGHERLASATAMRLGLREHEPAAAVSDRVLPAGRLRAQAGEVGVIGGPSRKPRAIAAGPCWAGRSNPSSRVGKAETGPGGQIGRARRRVLGDPRSRLNHRPFHHTPLC